MLPHILVTIDPAWLWLAGILGLYLYDALLLLAGHEWLLLYTGRRWQAVWPSDRWRWFGQRMWLPLPWRPDIPGLRVCWQPYLHGHSQHGTTASIQPRAETNTAEQAAASVPAHAPVQQSAHSDTLHTSTEPDSNVQQLYTHLQTLRHLRWCVWPLGLLLLALPLILKYAAQRDLWLLLCLALIYSCVLTLVVQMLRHRQALAISRAVVGKLALEYLLCPPFAVNAIRRLALERTVPGDALMLAHHVLSRPDWYALHRQLQTEVHTQLALLPEDAPESHSLALWWQDFVQRYPAPSDDDGDGDND